MPIRRSYSGVAPATVLTGDLASGGASFTVLNGTGYPDGTIGPFFVLIDRGLPSEEKILCTSRSSNTFTVASRGQDGTVAAAHNSQATVEHTVTAFDLDEMNEHTSDAAIDPHPQYSSSAELAAAIDVARAALVDVDVALDARIDALEGSVGVSTLINAKGDLLAGTANDTLARLGVGTNGQVLTASSGAATGLAWATPASSGTIATAGSYVGDDTGSRVITVAGLTTLRGVQMANTGAGGRIGIYAPGGGVEISVGGSGSTTSGCSGASFTVSGNSNVSGNTYRYTAIGV